MKSNNTNDIVLFSWRNNTLNQSFFLECKSLLNEQRKKGDVCTLVVSNQKSLISEKLINLNHIL